MRSFLIKGTLIIVIIIFAILLFVYGKQHKVYLDNKTVTVNNVEYASYPSVTVKIDGKSAVVRSRRRKVLYAKGPYHKIVVEYTKDGTKVTIEKDLKLDLNGIVIVNLPELIDGYENWQQKK